MLVFASVLLVVFAVVARAATVPVSDVIYGTSGQIIAIQAPFGAFPYTPCQTHDSVSCLLTDHPEKIGVLIDQTIPTKVVEDPSGKAVDCVVITLAEYNKVCNPGSGEEH